MPAVGHRNAGGAATIAEPFASRGDWRPARNLLADPNLHVVDQKRQPTGIACLLKRGGNRQSMDRLHRQLLRRQVATRQQAQSSVLCGRSVGHQRLLQARAYSQALSRVLPRLEQWTTRSGVVRKAFAKM